MLIIIIICVVNLLLVLDLNIAKLNWMQNLKVLK